MKKYKIFFVFAAGFLFATVIGIYKQNKVAGKANSQIAVANNVISGLQAKSKELETLKVVVEEERERFKRERYNYQMELRSAQETVASCPQVQCPVVPNPLQPKNGGEVLILPSVIQIQLGGVSYNCKAK
jgi:hypothetical protein